MSQSHNNKQKDKENSNSKSPRNRKNNQNANNKQIQQQNLQVNHKKANGAISTNHNKSKTPSPKGAISKINASGSRTVASMNNSTLATTAAARRKPQNKAQKERERAERETLVLWRRPVQTVKYCAWEVQTLMQTSAKK